MVGWSRDTVPVKQVCAYTKEKGQNGASEHSELQSQKLKVDR